MRRSLIIFLMLLLIPFVAKAERSFKVGFVFVYNKIEEQEVMLFGWELKHEWSVYKDFGLGLGFRKETIWAYDGYYLSLYSLQKIPFSKKSFLNIGLGADYGIASSKYDSYQTSYDQQGNLIYHKWIYLEPNVPIIGDFLKKGNTGIIYPFATISLGAKVGKNLSLEYGFKAGVMRFGIKSSKFEPTGLAYDVKEVKVWRLVPSFFIQLGIKLPSKRK